MKVTWSAKSDIEECPRCHSSLITCGRGLVICPSCAAVEIADLREKIKHLTTRAADEANARQDNNIIAEEVVAKRVALQKLRR